MACGALLQTAYLPLSASPPCAPWPADGLDYFAGMSEGTARELRLPFEGAPSSKGPSSE